jgi:hypothetical protein
MRPQTFKKQQENMDTPLAALHNVGERTLDIFKKAGLTTISDVYGKSCAQVLQAAIMQMKEEDTLFRDKDAYWKAMATRVGTIVNRVRSDEARPYEPDHFICPITLQMMTDPVISNFGDTYEKDAIHKLIALSGKDIYHRPLEISDLTENRSLRDAIQYYKLHELRFAIPVKLQIEDS